MFTFSKFLQVNVIAAIQKLNQTPEQKLKKRKPLLFKEFTLVKKVSLYFCMLIFLEKEKMEIKEEKTDVFISHKLLSRKPKQDYMNDSAL
jgi:hypothetical protein